VVVQPAARVLLRTLSWAVAGARSPDEPGEPDDGIAGAAA
jgi:hypothetical protein